MEILEQDRRLILLALVFIGIGLLINIYISLRKSRDSESQNVDKLLSNASILSYSILGHFFFYIGIMVITNFVSSRENSDYDNLLTIISLLSAGVISGYYSFDTSKYKKHLYPFIVRISICFNSLFYMLFGSIALFMARSTSVQKSNMGNKLIPTIMLIILVANTYYEHLNYLSKREYDSKTGD